MTMMMTPYENIIPRCFVSESLDDKSFHLSIYHVRSEITIVPCYYELLATSYSTCNRTIFRLYSTVFCTIFSRFPYFFYILLLFCFLLYSIFTINQHHTPYYKEEATQRKRKFLFYCWLLVLLRAYQRFFFFFSKIFRR